MMDPDQQLRNVSHFKSLLYNPISNTAGWWVWVYVFQLRDFLLVYNRMTEICFQRCSSNFNYRNLTMDEVGKAKITVTVSATWWYCLIAVFCVSTRFLSSVFFCRLFHLGVATADRLPSSHFTPSIVLCHINLSPPPLYPWIFSVVNGFSSFLPAYCLNRQQTLSNISPISPMHFYLNSLTSSPNCQI